MQGFCQLLLLSCIFAYVCCLSRCADAFGDGSFYQRQHPPCCHSECCCTTCPPSECARSAADYASSGNPYLRSSSCICENTAAFTCYRASNLQGVQSLMPMSPYNPAYVAPNAPVSSSGVGSYSISNVPVQPAVFPSNNNGGTYARALAQEDCTCDSPPTLCTPPSSCPTNTGSGLYAGIGYEDGTIFDNPWGIMIFVTIVVLAILIIILVVYLLCFTFRSRGSSRYSDEPAMVGSRRMHEWR